MCGRLWPWRCTFKSRHDRHLSAYGPHALTANLAVCRLKRPMDRRVAAAAGSSSLSTVLLHLLAQSLSSPAPPSSCPVELPPLEEFGIDNRSFLLGLLVLHGIKLLWRRSTTRWWAALCKHPLALYRVNEQ